MNDEIKTWLGRLEGRVQNFRAMIEIGSPQNVVHAAGENIQEAVHRIEALHSPTEDQD